MKTLIIVLVVLALGYGIYMFLGANRSSTVETETSGDVVSNGMPIGEVKTFTIIGKPFSFSLSEIRVKEGDTVKIVFQNSEGTHDWVIDEFNVRTPRIGTGESATIEFVASKKGTFEYYCSVGQHRAMGMKGNLIVD